MTAFPDSLFEQMQTEAEDDHCHSEDDFDEDEATQHIIEQSLIQYRKLKRLSPRSELKQTKKTNPGKHYCLTL